MNLNTVCSSGWIQTHDPSSAPSGLMCGYSQLSCFYWVRMVGIYWELCLCFLRRTRLPGIEHKIPPFPSSQGQDHIWCRRGSLISTRTLPSILSSLENGHQAHSRLREASSALSAKTNIWKVSLEPRASLPKPRLGRPSTVSSPTSSSHQKTESRGRSAVEAHGWKTDIGLMT